MTRPPYHDAGTPLHLHRRSVLGAGLLAAIAPAAPPAARGAIGAPALPAASQRCCELLARLPRGTGYALPGPLTPLELPRLEHTCSACFPACVGSQCLLGIDVTLPKGGAQLGLGPPFPLAVLAGGFTIGSAAYRSTAARLASWGYVVVRFNTRDALTDVLDDTSCVRLLHELLDWAATDPLLRRFADTRRVYLAGHSRGAKLAALTAAADPRVVALCLLDPVDTTPYAPLSERYPSAAAALERVARQGRFLPIAIVGSGRAGDCAPPGSNYSHFFSYAPAAAVEVLLPEAGHFQFTDSASPLYALCGGGSVSDDAVRSVSQAVLVSWAEAMVKRRGQDTISLLAARCGSTGTAPAAMARTWWSPPPADVPLQALQRAPMAATVSLPREQPRPVAWENVPPPAALQALRDELEQLLVSVVYDTGSELDVRTRYKNFGAPPV